MMSDTKPEPVNEVERRARSDIHRNLCETRAAILIAEIGMTMFNLASHPGAILRLGLSVRDNAGAFEKSGDAQREGFIAILDAIASAKEEARG